MDGVIGIHGIMHALANPLRGDKGIYATADGLEKFCKQSKLSRAKVFEKAVVKVVDGNKFDQLARKLLTPYQRVPGHIFLMASSLPKVSMETLYRGKGQKIIALDGVTDLHNVAAVLRTATFYGVSCLLVGRKGDIAFTPSFYRLACGATEFVPIIPTANLTRQIRAMEKKGIRVVGLVENATSTTSTPRPLEEGEETTSTCLVLGGEERGLSHGVRRVVQELFSLPAQGAIDTLNVSVAAGIGMEKFWGRNDGLNG